jgi:invasion protein IalB
MTDQRFLEARSLFISSLLALLMVPLLHLEIASGQQITQGAGAAANDKSSGEFALRGQRAAREIKYGDWQKFCFKVPGAKTVCRTTISGTFETGQTAVRIDLIEKEGETAARLQMFLPVGLYLQSGVKLTVDRGSAYRVPYMWCLTNTCIAADRADPNLIKEMETGQNLSLEVVDSSVLAVSTSLPLNQFSTVRQGAPARTFEQAIDE